ncbi:lipopolysaccharide-induced tumor necrosis factor-alpha factor homolog [Scomber japonicus]|uniref:lipopolysaccharide-induced tumor necrosis factor-alpha factor homolog n=1 Tax=Scomber japonicus TaxID=13676 RepID=UPI0023052D26|nr:lipopolysaccharide-induced tumor necrosis factor-alpha factor homolog [Scomber japonicus]
MDPPSYEEANLHPSALASEAFNFRPPPSYDASFPSPSPSTPPPTYGEAVTVLPDQFPVLTPPTVPTPVLTTQPTPVLTTVPTTVSSIGVITHQVTQVGVTPPLTSQQQPSPSASVLNLRDIPGLVQCPHCHQVVTTKVTYQPGKSAWCACVLFTMIGLVCGCCLIPFFAHGMQDVHHSCPQCGKHLHIFMR